MTTLRILALVVLAIGLCIVEATDCPSFECFNGGVCANSTANFSDHVAANGLVLEMHIETSRHGMHCECPSGFTGLFCKRPYESCDGTDQKCYNGGKCIPGLKDIYGNDQLYCDCSSAIDEDLNRYAGKYCEEKAIDICDSEDKVFCVNESKCKQNFSAYPDSPCECGNNSVGPHCEFQKDSVPECALQCNNGGSCRLGIKNYALAVIGYRDFWADSDNAMYCECPSGFFGALCEVSSIQCAGSHCFNGATCTSTNECNCSSANTATISYAGRYCQYQSNAFCNGNGKDFCVNGGVCKSSALGCTCPDGFFGPICEFHTSENNEDFADCKLTCQNSGQCRKGSMDLTLLAKFSLDSALGQGAGTGNEYCFCPDGFTGPECETKIEICGEGDHVCLHGSMCETNGGKHSCNCAVNEMNLKFAGSFCEHSPSSICTPSGLQETNEFAFCTNGGTCLGVAKEGQAHPGCSCPDGYAGSHCELRNDAFAAIGKSSTAGSESAMPNVHKETRTFFGVFFVVSLVVSGATYYAYRKRKEGQDKDFVRRAEMDGPPIQGHTSAPVLDMGPDMRFDGRYFDGIIDLKDVEII